MNKANFDFYYLNILF